VLQNRAETLLGLKEKFVSVFTELCTV